MILPGWGTSPRIERAITLLPAPDSPAMAKISREFTRKLHVANGLYRPIAVNEVGAEVLDFQYRPVHSAYPFISAASGRARHAARRPAG